MKYQLTFLCNLEEHYVLKGLIFEELRIENTR